MALTQCGCAALWRTHSPMPHGTAVPQAWPRRHPPGARAMRNRPWRWCAAYARREGPGHATNNAWAPSQPPPTGFCKGTHLRNVVCHKVLRLVQSDVQGPVQRVEAIPLGQDAQCQCLATRTPSLIREGEGDGGGRQGGGVGQCEPLAQAQDSAQAYADEQATAGHAADGLRRGRNHMGRASGGYVFVKAERTSQIDVVEPPGNPDPFGSFRWSRVRTAPECPCKR